MKKNIIAALLCIGLFSACERLIYINGDPGADPVMGIELSFLHVPAEGDSAISINISIYTPVEGGIVTAEADREWITIKELTNERAIVAVAPNPADTTRYGQITFSYNNEECTGLSVGQEGREGQ